MTEQERNKTIIMRQLVSRISTFFSEEVLQGYSYALSFLTTQFKVQLVFFCRSSRSSVSVYQSTEVHQHGLKKLKSQRVFIWDSAQLRSCKTDWIRLWIESDWILHYDKYLHWYKSLIKWLFCVLLKMKMKKFCWRQLIVIYRASLIEKNVVLRVWEESAKVVQIRQVRWNNLATAALVNDFHLLSIE